MDKLINVARSRGWWLVVALGAAGAEGVALYYQYALGMEPCVLCIHVRIWVAGLLVLGLAGMVTGTGRWSAPMHHLAGLVLSLGMLERSWETWATENGVATGSCGMSAELPAWFALDVWIPAVFEPREMCGYTPELMGGITMADGLLWGAGAAVGLMTVWLLVSLAGALRDTG